MAAYTRPPASAEIAIAPGRNVHHAPVASTSRHTAIPGAGASDASTLVAATKAKRSRARCAELPVHASAQNRMASSASHAAAPRAAKAHDSAARPASLSARATMPVAITPENQTGEELLPTPVAGLIALRIPAASARGPVLSG